MQIFVQTLLSAVKGVVGFLLVIAAIAVINILSDTEVEVIDRHSHQLLAHERPWLSQYNKSFDEIPESPSGNFSQGHAIVVPREKDEVPLCNLLLIMNDKRWVCQELISIKHAHHTCKKRPVNRFDVVGYPRKLPIQAIWYQSGVENVEKQK